MRNWLRDIREDAKISQQKVAQGCGITRQYYNSIERGRQGNPLNVDMAKKIAAVLGFDWQRFYEDETESA